MVFLKDANSIKSCEFSVGFYYKKHLGLVARNILPARPLIIVTSMLFFGPAPFTLHTYFSSGQGRVGSSPPLTGFSNLR